MESNQDNNQTKFDIWKADRIQKMYHFQPELVVLRGNVARLAERLQIALATWCCERLYPSYREWARSHGTDDRLRRVIDRLWGHSQGEDLDDTELEKYLTEFHADDFGEEQDDDLYWRAIGAHGVVWEALQACTGRREDHVVMACERCRNEVYQRIQGKHADAFGGLITPQDMPLYNAKIYDDPEMVREVKLQNDAIRLLIKHEKMTAELKEKLLAIP
jgi:hypothetical protein